MCEISGIFPKNENSESGMSISLFGLIPNSTFLTYELLSEVTSVFYENKFQIFVSIHES